MIPRYSRPEMTSIWSEQSKFQIWFEIEAHACDAMAELGMIPKDAARAVWERGGFDIDRINEIERETKHDVIAFLTSLAASRQGSDPRPQPSKRRDRAVAGRHRHDGRTEDSSFSGDDFAPRS